MRSHLQIAADAATLAMASAQVQGQTDIKQIGQDAFDVNFNAKKYGVSVVPQITLSENAIKVTVDEKQATTILNVLGFKFMDVGVASEAMLPTWIKAEVVLVLDYSSSMNSSGKYQAMRDAATDLVKVLSQDGENKDIKFGLVPFAEHVYGTMASDYIVDEATGGTWTNCTRDRQWPYNIEDTTPVASNDDTRWGMKASGKKKKKKKNDPYKDCGVYPARSLVISPLNDDHQKTLDQLADMYPYAGTHIALGLEFGWHVISPNPPWNEGVAYNDDEVVKVIVLLTDGRQSVEGNGPGGSSSDSNAEKNLEDMCETIKTKDVIMITVGFDLNDSTTLNRLKNCATSSAYFFDAKTNSDLKTAFANITGQIAGKTRLTK